MLRSPMMAILMALAAACQPNGTAGEERSAQVTSPPPAAAQVTPAATGVPAGGARSVELDGELFAFEYSYPKAAGEIASLKALLDRDIVRRREELERQAREARANATRENFPFNPFGLWMEWRVVTELPAWLSLSGHRSDYKGGAHPNHGFETILWDKEADRPRKALDLFTSTEALSRVLRSDFCRALDRQRAEKRGEAVRAGSDGLFDECIDPLESTIVLGSSSGKAFDRIGVLVPPYAAGPYAEGSYEVTLPVTGAVLDLVKPEYRSAFAAAP